MRGELILFLVLLFSQIATAQSSDLAFSRNARTYETQHTSLVVKGLANACLTLALVPDGLPCNPAMTPLNDGAGLGISFQLSNGYASLDSIRKILDAKITPEVIESFFYTLKWFW